MNPKWALQKQIAVAIEMTRKAEGSFAIHVLARDLIRNLPPGISTDELMTAINKLALKRGAIRDPE